MCARAAPSVQKCKQTHYEFHHTQLKLFRNRLQECLNFCAYQDSSFRKHVHLGIQTLFYISSDIKVPKSCCWKWWYMYNHAEINTILLNSPSSWSFWRNWDFEGSKNMPAPTALRIVQLWWGANTCSYALEAGSFREFPLCTDRATTEKSP